MTYPDEKAYNEVFQQYQYCSEIRAFIADGKEKDSQFELFLEDKIRNPTLTHINLKEYDPELIINHLSGDLSILNILPKELQEIYKIAIRSTLTMQHLISASTQQKWDKFDQHNEEYYGEIPKDIQAYVFMRLNNLLDKSKDHKELAENIDYVQQNVNLSYDDDEAQKVVDLVKSPIPKDLASEIKKACGYEKELPEQESFEPKEIIPIFEEALHSYKISDWKVEIHPHFEGMTVSAKKKTVFLPRNKEYSRKYLTKLIPHEIGVHVQRAFLTHKSPYKIFARSKVSTTEEEGLSQTVEKAIFEKSKLSTLPFLCICLVLGKDGTKRDFRDLFTFLTHYYQILDKTKERKPTEPRKIWSRCIKTFMGTDYQTPGVCLYRTKDYLEKGIRGKEFLLKNPDMFEFIMNHKYNYLNEPLHNLAVNLLNRQNA